MTANRIGQGGPGILDFGTAALAAVSAGFVAFAMPEGTFAAIVEATRLPDLISAAQPPLGQTARLAAVAAGAVLTFLLVFSLMRALDRLPAGSKPTVIDKAPETPRVRRADSHPDAPARRPLLARRDLGEPEADDILDTADFLQTPEAPAPVETADIDQAPKATDTAEPVEAPEVVQPPEPVEAIEAIEEENEPEAAEELREHDEIIETAKPASQPQREPFADFLDPVEPEEDPWFSEPLPATRASPAPAAQAEPEEAPLELSPDDVAADRTEAATEATEHEEEDSVGALMERLERGLDQRQKPQALTPEGPEPAAVPSRQADQVGHRLRSAISELQKVASRDS